MNNKGIRNQILSVNTKEDKKSRALSDKWWIKVNSYIISGLVMKHKEELLVVSTRIKREAQVGVKLKHASFYKQTIVMKNKRS